MKSHIPASTRLARAFTLATLFSGLSVSSLFATNYGWTTLVDGNWSDLTKWAAQTGTTGSPPAPVFGTPDANPVTVYPNATDDGAYFANNTGTARVVNLDVNATVGTVVFSGGTWTISSNNGSALTLATSTGTPNISSTGTINATIAGTQGFTMNPGGIRTLTLGGANSYSGITTLTNGNIIIRSNTALGATGTGNHTVVSQNSGAAPQLHLANNISTAEDITLRMNQTGAAAGAVVGSNLIYNDSGNNTLTGAIVLDRTGASSTNHIHWFGVQVTGAGSVININGNVSGAATAGQPSGTYTDPTRFQFRTTAATAAANIGGVISNGTLTTNGLSVYTATDNTGVVRLSGANTYTGSTVHQKGTLLINNAGPGSGTGTGAVSVAATATFGGTGTIAPTGTNGVTLASGSILAPGDVASDGSAINAGESLSFDFTGTTGGATFTGATISFNLTGGPTALVETLDFVGLANSSGVVFGGNTVNFSVVGTLAEGLYTLATFDTAGKYTQGQWTIGSGLEAYSKQLIYNANSIQLQISAVPEPSSFAALGGFAALGFAAVGRRRRR